MYLKTLLAAAVAAAFAFPALANDTAKHDKSAASGASSPQSKSESDEFSKLDKNHDGFVSKAEAKGSEHEKDFDKLDKNHDGKLSRDEHNAGEKSAKSESGGNKAG